MSPPPRRPFRFRPRSTLALWGLVLAFAGCDGSSSQNLPVPDAGACVQGNCPQPDSGTPVDPSGTRVRIAAFNVHRLFDTVCDTGSCGGTNYEELPTPEQFEAQVGQLGPAITALNADIVMLEEVETQNSLDGLLTKVPQFPHSHLGETYTKASVDVAVLSRHAITEVRSHRNQYIYRPDGSATRFSRDLLEVHVDVDGTRVIVFAAHFRSKVDDDPGRRMAEANAAREILLASAKEFPDAMIVLGGDLNDIPGSEPINALDQALLRVAKDRPDNETWTYFYSGRGQAIDHLYLAPNGGGVYVPGSFRVARGPTGGYGGSDHGAVYADFALTPP
ncbi:endonuclease/exonuclease/phosphatase family protein [Corallococcus sp. AB004]|uniref:endonuclease/exonuclease/phosphatase family protein n=1 Tax=Corallococcus TaxID=83461 RepID=UPI000EA1D151|nr:MULTISPECIES: endonuclease/exonuclease/phosphatase family protein [Corallococcus]NPD27311.1 endonuclease/exonuclease/phosphatase family protein [Corallococcus exiguus]RKI00241.1 endonuclease/exonuclease/phosphatase family protein [Corallococcus sp. AB038B]RKI36778.1 endonuclease/exonuclease/phosphatase family protein [Corallococcus sp. AB004]